MKVCLVVPDGVGIKNYLFTDILPILSDQGHEILIWHTLTQNAINEVQKVHPTVKFQTFFLKPFKEGKLSLFIRESIAYARLLYNTKLVHNPTIMDNQRKSLPKKFLARNIYRLTRTLGYIASKNYKYILFLESKYQKILENSSVLDTYKSFIKENDIEVLFCTHQRSIAAIPVIAAGNDLNIDTYSVIYSWDNLPKGRLSIRSKYYCVWSDYMKNEMQKFYPEITKENIQVTGTPQFEFYKDTSLLLSKEEFFKRYDLDIRKKTICFSGDDYRTSPYDPQYLEDLAESLTQNEEQDFQILFRRCPVDLSDRYDYVIKKFPDMIKVSTPIWNFDGDNGNWELVYPSYKDVELLVNTAYHCDGVYNVGSTMAHDFAMFGKPAFYINYDHTVEQEWKTSDVYQFEHFKSMQGLNAVVWIDTKEEISRKIANSIVDSDKIATQRQDWFRRITDNILNASEKISDYISTGEIK